MPATGTGVNRIRAARRGQAAGRDQARITAREAERHLRAALADT
jgi:hypothetical protein